MKKVPKIPRIRVKGFTQEWTEHLLNYYLETSQEKNFDGLYQKEDVLSVSGDCGIVNQIEFQGRSFAGASVLNYGVVHTGDVVYTKSPLKENPYGIIKTNTGKAGIVSTLYAVYHPKEVTYSEFVQWYFENNDRLNHYLNPLVNKGAKNDMKVSSDNALLGTVIFPDSAEQKAVSDSLTHIKNIILQCEFRLEKLQALKASMLEKMFPKDGADVPEVRFKGFTDVWICKKLGDCCQITMGQSPDGSTYSDFPSDYILVQGNADLKNGWVSPRTWTTQKTKTAEAGDLIMSVRAPAGAMGKTKYDVVLGRGVAGIKGDEFIYQSLVKMDGSDYWKKLASGSTFESINSDIISNCEIALPQDTKEREKIGIYFYNLDHLITFQQQELDKLQSIKKALLEKMFV